jgi:hypothetical protein
MIDIRRYVAVDFDILYEVGERMEPGDKKDNLKAELRENPCYAVREEQVLRLQQAEPPQPEIERRKASTQFNLDGQLEMSNPNLNGDKRVSKC